MRNDCWDFHIVLQEIRDKARRANWRQPTEPIITPEDAAALARWFAR